MRKREPEQKYETPKSVNRLKHEDRRQVKLTKQGQAAVRRRKQRRKAQLEGD